MINKISFISYPVSNLQQSIIFYRDLLGLKFLLKKDAWAEFTVYGQRFAIPEENFNPEVNKQTGATVYFEAKPIKKMVHDLKLKGVFFKGEIEEHEYGKLILFSDPDNNSLGLYEPFG